jgi:hypothetical protein
MNTKHTLIIFAAALLIVGTISVANPAAAATKVAERVAAVASSSPAKLKAEQKKADEAITKRVEDLNKVIARTNDMTRLSDSDKATVQTALQTIVSNLTTLAGKIDAETDAAALKDDVESITKNFRIYALVIPRTHIIATADRIVTVAGTLNIVGQKLATRVAAASSTSATTLQTTLQDMSTKVIDAQAQAQSATQLVASLQPDNGDAAITKSNQQALKDAQAKIKVAQSDIVAAQKDARAVQKALKKMAPAASSTPAH